MGAERLTAARLFYRVPLRKANVLPIEMEVPQKPGGNHGNPSPVVLQNAA